MMYPEFEIEMKSLVTEYTMEGRQPPYGKNRIDAIYKCFKNKTVSEFKEIIERAFMSERQAPLAKDLLRINEELRIERHNKTKENELLREAEFKEPDPIHVKTTIENVRSILQGVKIND